MPEKIPAFLLLVGDSYLTNKKFEEHLTLIQQSFTAKVSTQTIYLTQSSLDSVLLSSRNLSFLAEIQVFRLKESAQLKEKQIELLQAYLERPADSAYLVFETEALAKDSLLMKLASARGHVNLLEDSAKRSAGSQMIREKLGRAGKTLAPDVLQKLQEEAGDEPSLLESLLEQLIIRAGQEKEISFQMFESFRENWKEDDAFSLTDAVASRNAGKALRLLRSLLGSAENEPFALVGILHWQIRRIWLARILLEEGIPEGQVLQKCRVFGNRQGAFLRQVRAFSCKKIENVLDSLFKVDWGLKTGQVDGQTGLETWVVEAAS